MCILENKRSSEIENVKKNQCLMTILRNITLIPRTRTILTLVRNSNQQKENQDAFPDKDFKATIMKMLQ